MTIYDNEDVRALDERVFRIAEMQGTGDAVDAVHELVILVQGYDWKSPRYQYGPHDEDPRRIDPNRCLDPAEFAALMGVMRHAARYVKAGDQRNARELGVACRQYLTLRGRVEDKADRVTLDQVARLIIVGKKTIHNKLSEARKTMTVPNADDQGLFRYSELRPLLLKWWPAKECYLPESFDEVKKLLFKQ